MLTSRLLVASSKMRTCGSLTRALAMAMHCFCPEDSFPPHSPTSETHTQLRGQMAERLGNGAITQKVCDVGSLGKAIHPTCLGGMSLHLL